MGGQIVQGARFWRRSDGICMTAIDYIETLEQGKILKKDFWGLSAPKRPSAVSPEDTFTKMKAERAAVVRWGRFGQWIV